MDLLQKMSGVDVYFPAFDTFVHQPTITEISMIGEEVFFRGVEIFAASNKEAFTVQKIKEVPEESRAEMQAQLDFVVQTDMDVFYQICSEQRYQLIVNALLYMVFPSIRDIKWIQLPPAKVILQLAFDHKLSEGELVEISQKMSPGASEREIKELLESKSKKVFQLNEERFDELKELIVFLFTYKTNGDKESELKPIGDLAKRIAEKMEKAQEKKNAIYGHNQKNKAESIISTMVSMLSTSDGIPLSEVLKLTLPQLLIQLNRTQLLHQYQTQITLGAFGGLDADDIVDWQKPV